MKSKFFSLKLIVTIFVILLGLGMAYLSSAPKYQVQEVHKEIQLPKK